MNENAEDITMRAIGRSPARDRVEVEALLAEDLELAEQLRETEDLAVEIWQASSPLESAPPELWEEIEASLAVPESPFRKYWLPTTAALGWAAALALAALFVFKNNPTNQTAQTPLQATELSPQTLETPPTPIERIIEEEKPPQNPALKKQLASLQRQLSELRNPSRAVIAPNVIALHPPGTAQFRTPEEERAKLLNLLASALEENLQRQGEHPVDLIIEEGWDPKVFSADSKLLIRHRNFLTATADLDLMIAPNGDYYEPSSQYLWSPAEDGGGYLGQAADDALDLESFAWVERKEERSNESRLAHADGNPQGYVLQDTSTGEATLILDGLGESATNANLFARYVGPDGDLMQHTIQSSSVGGTTIFTTGLGDINLMGSFSVGSTSTTGKEFILMNSGE